MKFGKILKHIETRKDSFLDNKLVLRAVQLGFLPMDEGRIFFGLVEQLKDFLISHQGYVEFMVADFLLCSVVV